jgi:branched-chain amino acid transport system substrate-binding protein
MNKTAKIIVGLVVILLVVWGLISISKPNQGETIKIGYFGPLSGPVAASTGESMARAFQIASANQSLAAGKKIEVIYEDDACDPKKAVSAAQKLLEIDKVHILVSGLCSGSTLAVAPMAEQNKVILISPGSAAPSITTAGDYVFRLAASSATAGQAVANELKAHGYKTIAILFENNEYPVGWKDSLIKEYGQVPGVKIVAEGANVGSTDVRSQLLKLAEAKPDVLLITTLTAPMANAALNQYHQLKLSTPIVGNETFSLQAVIHNPYTEGMLVTAYKYDDGSADFRKFLSEYEAKYHTKIQEEIYGALSYDTAKVLFDSIVQCQGDNPACVKSYLYSIKNRPGLSGTITIDSNGDAQREFVLKKIESGKTVSAY